jgi:hypothetical protein
VGLLNPVLLETKSSGDDVMSFEKWDHHSNNAPPLTHTESVVDRRAAAARREAEELDRRRAELAQLQTSTVPISDRIRLWEVRYGLALPRDPAHPLLECVANATRLTLDDVRREQQARLNVG